MEVRFFCAVHLPFKVNACTCLSTRVSELIVCSLVAMLGRVRFVKHPLVQSNYYYCG